MNIIRFSNFVKESFDTKSLEDNDGILFIVDVQSAFKDFIPQNFEKNITKYCEDFPKNDDERGVYQIWDANKAENFSYNFPNTVLTVKKNYGLNFDKKIKKLAKKLSRRYGEIEEGKRFKLKDRNTYLVKVNNNHKWFYVNEDLTNLFEKLIGKTIVVVGGADSECLEDVYVSMKAFGLEPIYNYDYIYSAETSDEQVAAPKK